MKHQIYTSILFTIVQGKHVKRHMNCRAMNIKVSDTDNEFLFLLRYGLFVVNIMW